MARRKKKRTYIDKKGYVRFRGSGKLLHRWIAEKRILRGKRKLRKNEVVHHRDGNPTHNALRNLRIMTRGAHNELHERKSPGWARRHNIKLSEDERPQGCALTLLGLLVGIVAVALLLAACSPSSPAPRVQKLEELTVTLPGGVPMTFVKIPPGEFMMGSDGNEDEFLPQADERPRHPVRITEPFYLGRTEVTQRQWEAVMGETWFYFRGDRDRPADCISWDQAQVYVEKLTRLGQGTFRLPTEAEWEYACRAGTTTRYWWGDDPHYRQVADYVWFEANSGDTPHRVGTKRPNPWGLHDVLGNVMEWCEDWYGPYPSGLQVDPQGPSSGEDRVRRGGVWSFLPSGCRPADRAREFPDEGNYIGGVRIVRECP
jgi:formylglycine-generating enzyme required for sulfatase activity